jgi:hypothetical protein
MAKKTSRRTGSVKRRLTAWSYSRWSTYEDCPRRARYRYLDKLPEGPKGRALVRGGEIHAEGEAFLKGDRRMVPQAFEAFRSDLRALRRSDALAEAEWAFTKDWKVTGWFDDDAWVRMKIDAHLMAGRGLRQLRIIDFKTGQIRPANEVQLELYAVGGFSTYEKVTSVKAEFWYLDHGVIDAIEFQRNELNSLRNVWDQRTLKMLNDTRFAIRPNTACRWCAYSKAKGGPCEI